MSVEWFLKLKEIDSLTKSRAKLQEAKKEQEDRLSKLDERRQEALLQTAKLKQETVSLASQLSDIEVRLRTANEQKQRLLDLGGDDKKIERFTEEISQLEERGFELLTLIENAEKAISDEKTFLTGIEKTIKEISEEVEAEINKINEETKNLDLRITYLMGEIPDDFKKILEKVSAKNPAHGPFTRVEHGKCFFCRYQISRIDESEIDMQKNLKTCRQCGRIFLPFGS